MNEELDTKHPPTVELQTPDGWTRRDQLVWRIKDLRNRVRRLVRRIKKYWIDEETTT